jgi:hypothetical protein
VILCVCVFCVCEQFVHEQFVHLAMSSSNLLTGMSDGKTPPVSQVAAISANATLTKNDSQGMSAISEGPKSLLDSIAIIEKLTEGRKKSVIDALKFFSFKMDTVRTFGKKLQDLTEGMPKFGVRGELEGGCIQKGIEVVRAMEEHLGMMYCMMEVEMKEKVINPIEAEKERTNTITKNALSEMYRLEKEQRDNLAKIVKVQQKYYKSREDSVELEKMLESESFEMGDPEELRAQMMQKQREIIESRDLYIASVKNARTAKLYGDRRISKLIDAMQTLEKERIESLTKSIRNYVELQVRSYRLLVEEVEAASRVLVDEVKFSSEEELRKSSAFLHGTLTGQSLPVFHEWIRVEKQSGISNLFSFLKPKKQVAENPSSDDELKLHPSDPIEESHFAELRGRWITWFEHQFDCIGNSIPCKCAPPQSNQDIFQSLLSRAGRKVFSQILATYRNKNGGLVNNKESRDNIVAAMITCLDSVDTEVSSITSPKAPRSTARDVAPVKEVMIVSQTLHFSDGASHSFHDNSVNGGSVSVSANSSVVSRASSGSLGKKDFLAKFIKHHPLWKDERLWDEMLFASVQNEKAHKRMFEIDSWLADEESSSLRQSNSNVIFGQIANIAHSMTLFENSAERARQFVEKTSRLHELPEELKMQILITIDIESQPEATPHSPELIPRTSALPDSLPAAFGPPPGIKVAGLQPPAAEESGIVGSSSPGAMIDFLTSPIARESAAVPRESAAVTRDSTLGEQPPIPQVDYHDPAELTLDEKELSGSFVNSPPSDNELLKSSSSGKMRFSKAPAVPSKSSTAASWKSKFPQGPASPKSPNSPNRSDDEKEKRTSRPKALHIRRSSSNKEVKPIRHSRSSSSNASSALRESASQPLQPQDIDADISPHDKKTRVPTDSKRRI